MPRKAKSAAAPAPTPEQAEAAAQAVVEQVTESPDVFDQAIENRQAAEEFERQARELPRMTAEELARPVDPLPAAREVVESVAESTRIPEESPAPAQGGHTARHRPDGPKHDVQPDPHGFESITLGEDNDSPRMRLYRHNRTNEGHGAGILVIQFDQKPVGPEGEESKYLDMIRDAGFRWNQRDEVWKKPIDPDSRWRSVAEAQKVFDSVGNAIRKDLGLDVERAIEM